MSNEPAAPATARHALAHRIRRFVSALQRFRRNPNRREAYHVVEALQCLQEGQYEEGEAAVLRAEKVAPLPASIADKASAYETLTTDQICDGLDAIMRMEE